MEIYDVMRSTAAVREFAGEELPDRVLYRIIENARFAPSGGNRQGVTIIVVRDLELRRALAGLVEPIARRFAAQQAAGENPWSPCGTSSVTDAQVLAVQAPRHLVEPIVQASTVLVFCLNLCVIAATDKNLDRLSVVGGASIYPLVWNVLLAARNEGYGGTITTLGVAAETEIKELLGIPDGQAVAAIVPLGRPSRQLSKLRRRSVSELTRINTWSGPPLDANQTCD